MYSIDKYYGNEEQANLLLDLTRRVSNHQDERHFICHLIHSTITGIQRKEGLWVPIPSTFIRKTFRYANIYKYKEEGVVELTQYDRDFRTCRYFKLKDKVWEAYLNAHTLYGKELTIDLVKAYMKEKTWELIAFKEIKKKPLKTKYTIKESKESIPSLIKKAFKAMDLSTPIQMDNIIEHLNSLLDKKRYFYKGSKNYDNAERKYLNDLFSLTSVLDQKPSFDNSPEEFGNICNYKPAYDLKSTGRIYVIGGGLQNASREMKQAAYDTAYGVKNYDIQSSQACILKEEFDKHDISCKWLEDYLKSKKNRTEAAKRVGISEKCWKACFYALLNGGRKKAMIKIFNRLDIYRLQPTKQDELYEAFKQETNSLRKALNIWYRCLQEEFYNNAKSGRGYLSMKNACGCKFTLRMTKEEFKYQGFTTKEKMKYVAFVLQGREAAFIHHLAVLGRENKPGFLPLANEHDGLITTSEIPDRLVQMARERSGFKTAKIVEKPFV